MVEMVNAGGAASLTDASNVCRENSGASLSMLLCWLRSVAHILARLLLSNLLLFTLPCKCYSLAPLPASLFHPALILILVLHLPFHPHFLPLFYYPSLFRLQNRLVSRHYRLQFTHIKIELGKLPWFIAFEESSCGKVERPVMIWHSNKWVVW